MTNLLISKNVETQVSLFEISVTVYDQDIFQGNVSFCTDWNKDALTKNLKLDWNDEYNIKDEYLIIMKDSITKQSKRVVIKISERFKNTVSVNRSYIESEILWLYKQNWDTYTILER